MNNVAIPEQLFLIYICMFTGVLLAFEGLRALLSRNESQAEARNRRMRMIAKGASPDAVLALLRPGEERGPLSRVPILGTLPKALGQAGWRISPSLFILLCGVLAGIVFILGGQALDHRLALMASGVAGFLLPVAALQAAQRKRMEKLEKQLPDALDLMARGLKVGHPLNISVATVARETPDPLGTEFGLVFDQVSCGDDIATAFADLAKRIGTEDVHLLSVTVGIQHGIGGNLGRVLNVLAQVIRDRAVMRQKITSLSSEGRLSSNILSSLPVVIFLMTSWSAPAHFRDVAGDPLFRPMAIGVVVLVVANYAIMRKLVTFRF